MAKTAIAILCKLCAKAPDESTTFFVCSACRGVHYCSKECQRADWKSGHKSECTVLVARNAALGAGHDEVKKWIDRNRQQFMLLVWKLLDVDSDKSMLSSHVVVLGATYCRDKRAVEIKDHFIAPIDEVDASHYTDPDRAHLLTESDQKTLRQMFDTPHPNSLGDLFSIIVVRMTLAPNMIVRMVPLACESSIAEFVSRCKELERIHPTEETVENLLLGTC